MSQQSTHSSLYRKYRPAQFDEIVGQSHIVRVLQEEAKKAQPSHAYLFAGSRGTGKTTLARIFAQNIGTSPEDIYEIDAASNTSVEDIRLLNEAVYTMPLVSKFKVYILDEVHMLSKSAFNAFLKTLEEPPKHVIFILATTELHKIPETIISRCQTFYLQKPTVEMLRKMIIDIAAKEGIALDEKSAEIIAMVGNGSFRDTLSCLQSVVGIALATDKDGGSKGSGALIQMSVEEVEKIISVPPHQMVAQFVEAVIGTGSSALAGSASAASTVSTTGSAAGVSAGLAILKKVHESDMDVRIFADLAMSELRSVMLADPAGPKGKAAMNMLDILLRYRQEIGKTYISILPLELALLKFFSAK